MNNNIGLLIPHLQSGGAERVLTLTSNLLFEKGYNVYFFVFDANDISYKYSGNLINLNSFSGNNVFIKVLNRIVRIIKMTYYKKKYSLNSLISFLYSANVVNYYSVGKTKKIISCRGYGDYLKNGKKYISMLPKIHSMIIQTERLKEEIKQENASLEDSLTVLHNPFDIVKIKGLAEEKIEGDVNEFISNHKTICTIGSFKKDKGFWHLIKSFIEVKKYCEDAGLIFIGNRGEMEQEIKEMAQKSGYKNDILFLNYQENPFKYVSRCDLYVCSSLYEGFPNAIVEALACSVPVVSTDCPTGPREILIDDDNISPVNKSGVGLLSSELSNRVDFDINNIEKEEKELAKNIVSLLNNPQKLKQFKENSFQKAKMFSMEKYIERLILLIEDKKDDYNE